MNGTIRSVTDGRMSLTDVIIDKRKLLAQGKVMIAGAESRFVYDFYGGGMQLDPEPSGSEASDIKDGLKGDILNLIFPIVGRDHIGKLLGRVGEYTYFTQGSLSIAHYISASDVLVQLSHIVSEPQVIRTDDGEIAVITPEGTCVNRVLFHKDGDRFDKKSFMTFQDAVSDLPEFGYITDGREKYIRYVKEYEERRNEKMSINENVLLVDVRSEYEKKETDKREKGYAMAYMADRDALKDRKSRENRKMEAER